MKKKILIVDDEPDLLTVTRFRLEKAGYEVLTAIDGKEALITTAKELPDLILLDVRLPLMSGMEVCAQLRKDKDLTRIPVILFTASMSNLQKNIDACGAQDYVIKPFATKELLAKIKKWID